VNPDTACELKNVCRNRALLVDYDLAEILSGRVQDRCEIVAVLLEEPGLEVVARTDPASFLAPSTALFRTSR